MQAQVKVARPEEIRVWLLLPLGTKLQLFALLLLLLLLLLLVLV